jgi:hypothetical protein
MGTHARIRAIFLALFAASGLANAGPYDFLSARWAGPLKMTSTNRGTTGVDSVWNGDIYGQIDPVGRIRFALDNGCQIAGNVTPAGSSGKFDLVARINGCNVKTFNDVYTGAITPDGQKIIMTATASRLVMVASEALSFTVTLSRY